MVWTYHQKTGQLFHNDTLIHTGYSGYEAGKNNPDLQHVRNVGPIPIGIWDIDGYYYSRKVGPLAIILDPDSSTKTFGRSAFRIHGDSASHPGKASRGCVIMPRAIRQKIIDSGDETFIVVKE